MVATPGEHFGSLTPLLMISFQGISRCDIVEVKVSDVFIATLQLAATSLLLRQEYDETFDFLTPIAAFSLTTSAALNFQAGVDFVSLS